MTETAPTPHDDSLAGSLRQMLHAQRALQDAISTPDAGPGLVDERRRDLVVRLTAYRSALLSADQTVPRAIAESLQAHTLLLPPAELVPAHVS